MTYVAKILAVLGLVTLSSCTVEKNLEDDKNVVAKAAVTNLTSNNDENKYIAAICNYDANNGVLSAAFTGEGSIALTFRIKGFSETPKTYSCGQNQSNRASDASVGSKYDTCGVEIAVLDSETSTMLNTYSTHRETTDVPRFTYAGTCSIEMTNATGTAEGTISCTKMVETKLNGQYRFPIDENVTSDIAAAFKCKL